MNGAASSPHDNAVGLHAMNPPLPRQDQELRGNPPEDSQGCRKCHTIGQEGKLGFTKEGHERAQGFEGCISTLKAMTIIAKVPEDKRSPTQLRRVQRFQEFGCSNSSPRRRLAWM